MLEDYCLIIDLQLPVLGVPNIKPTVACNHSLGQDFTLFELNSTP